MNYRGYTIPDTKESILELDAKVNPGAAALLWQDDKFGEAPVSTCVTVEEMETTTNVNDAVARYVEDVKRIIDFHEDGTTPELQ